MEYRRLGRSGLQVSPLVLGTMNFGLATDTTEACRLVDMAIDQGINLIDCADIYAGGEAERMLGEALQRNGRRHDILLTTKVYNRTGPGPNERGNSKHHLYEACEKSLRQLQTDHIDIYFLHRHDENVAQEESLAALDLLMRQGKIRYIACSTHPPWRTVEAIMLADKFGYPKYTCEQPPYNLLDRRIENEFVPMCQAYDMGIIAWSPLAHGVLAGRYQDAATLPKESRGSLRDVFRERITQAGIDVGRQFEDLAQAEGCTAAQLAVAWVLHQPGITASILGPRTVEQFEELLPAAELRLTEGTLKGCDALVAPGRHVVNYFNTSVWMK